MNEAQKFKRRFGGRCTSEAIRLMDETLEKLGETWDGEMEFAFPDGSRIATCGNRFGVLADDDESADRHLKDDALAKAQAEAEFLYYTRD